MVEVDAEARAVADTVGEVTGELFHLTDGLWPLSFFQHGEIAFHDRIAIFLLGLPVSAGGEILGDLTEDPGVVTGGAADHDCIAVSKFEHADGVFRRDDIAVADDGDFDGGFDLGDTGPIGFAGVALLAGARVEGEGGEADVLGHFGDLDVDEFIVVPTGAELHREGDGDRRFDGFEDVGDEGEVAEAAGAAVAADDLFDGAAEVDVDEIEAEILAVTGGVGHDFRVGAEELGGDGVFFGFKAEVAFFGLGGFVFAEASDDAVAGCKFRHDEAAAALGADEATEDGIGDPYHGGEHRGGGDQSRANCEISWKSAHLLLLCWVGAGSGNFTRQESVRRVMNSKVLLAFVGGVAATGLVVFLLSGRGSEQKADSGLQATAQTQTANPDAIVERPVSESNGNAADVAAGMEPVRPKTAAGAKLRVLGGPVKAASGVSKVEAGQQAPRASAGSSPGGSPGVISPALPATSAKVEPTHAEVMRTDPVAKPAPARTPETVIVPIGTSISVRIASTLNSEKNVTGDTFTATLDTPLVVNDIVLAERGAKVEGKISEVDRSGRVKGVAKMMLELTRIQLSDGQQLDLRTDPWERDAESSKKADAAKVGVGAAIGAAIGAIVGGGKGAAIGGASGAGAGTGVVLATRGKPVQIDVETKIPFRLSTALTVTEKIR